MRKRPPLFLLKDLIAPIGVCAVTAALCVWGAVSVQEIAGRWISAATGLVFLSGIPAWYIARSLRQKPTFKTTHGLRVIHGKRTKPSKKDIETWTESTIAFWKQASFKHLEGDGLNEVQLRAAADGLTVFFHDRENVSPVRRALRGYSKGSMFAVGLTDKSVDSLFSHELSHQILYWSGVGSGLSGMEQDHHELFDKMNLGA